jgi:hypothetical protein
MGHPFNRRDNPLEQNSKPLETSERLKSVRGFGCCDRYRENPRH